MLNPNRQFLTAAGLGLLIFACSRASNEPPKGKPLLYANIRYPYEVLSRENANIYWTDTLGFINAEFNGLPVFTSLSAFKLHAKTDSVVSEAWMCGSPFDWEDKGYHYDSIQHYYFKKAEYISNGNMVFLLKAPLKNNKLYLRSRDITLTESTTLEEFRAVFTKAYARERKRKGYINSTGELVLDVAFGKYESHWKFTFINGMLHEVELWWLLC